MSVKPSWLSHNPMLRTFPRAEVSGARRQEIAPLLCALLRLRDERWSGTALIRDGARKALATLRFEAGRVTSGHVPSAASLMHGVIALCGRSDVWLEAVDALLLAAAGDQATEVLDLLPLSAAVIRATLPPDRVRGALAELERATIRLAPDIELPRYGFDARELATLDAFANGPIGLDDLRARSVLPAGAFDSLLLTLWLTGAITFVATSGCAPRSRRGDEPTLIAPLATASAAAESCRGALERASSVPPASSDRSSAPTARDGRYHLRAPENGTASIALPTRGLCARRNADRDTSSRLEADVHFEVAERMFRLGYVREAVFQAQAGMRRGQPRPEQRALYAWLIYQRDGAGARASKPVWEHLERALELDPTCVSAYYYLGMICKASQQMKAASRHLRRACALDPAHREAALELALLEPSESGEPVL